MEHRNCNDADPWFYYEFFRDLLSFVYIWLSKSLLQSPKTKSLFQSPKSLVLCPSLPNHYYRPAMTASFFQSPRSLFPSPQSPQIVITFSQIVITFSQIVITFSQSPQIVSTVSQIVITDPRWRERKTIVFHFKGKQPYFIPHVQPWVQPLKELFLKKIAFRDMG